MRCVPVVTVEGRVAAREMRLAKKVVACILEVL